MTLEELVLEYKEETDNESEMQDTIVFINSVIREINLRASAKFKTISLDQPNEAIELEVLTGVPEILQKWVTEGIKWKLQMREDEATWTVWENRFLGLISRYMHLIPENYRLGKYTAIEEKDCYPENGWEILF